MTTTKTTTKTELEQQIAALVAQLHTANQTEAVVGHFTTTEGAPLTNPGEIDDALLRALGTQAEARLKVIDVGGWMDKSPDTIESELGQALTDKRYVDVALYAGMLDAKRHLAAA